MSRVHKLYIPFYTLFFFVGYLFVVFLIHFSNLNHLIVVDWSRNDFDYCYLIPFVFLYLLYVKRDKMIKKSSNQSLSGLIVIGIGGLLTILGELAGEFLISYIAFWLMLIGYLWAIWGGKKFYSVIFPFIILLSMFPPPSYIYSRVTLNMQMISSFFAEKILQLTGIPVYREGNIIDIGMTKIQVVAACSGLRYLIPIFIVSLIMAYLMESSRRAPKIFLVVMSFPLAIGMNALRLVCTGLLVRHVGSWAIEGIYHEALGWVVFGVSIVILFAFMIFFERKTPYMREKITILPVFIRENGLFPNKKYIINVLCIVVVMISYITLSIQKNVQANIKNIHSLKEFPLTIDNWTGTYSTINNSVLKSLDLTDYALIDYIDDQGILINFYLAYYASQNKGESIHSPETCLRGGGWNFDSSNKKKISSKLYVSRSVLSKGGKKILMYFWFPCRGRNITNALELKFYNFWDRLIYGRSDGALIRLITQINGNQIQDADNRLVTFIERSYNYMEFFLTPLSLE